MRFKYSFVFWVAFGVTKVAVAQFSTHPINFPTSPVNFPTSPVSGGGNSFHNGPSLPSNAGYSHNGPSLPSNAGYSHNGPSLPSNAGYAPNAPLAPNAPGYPPNVPIGPSTPGYFRNAPFPPPNRNVSVPVPPTPPYYGDPYYYYRYPNYPYNPGYDTPSHPIYNDDDNNGSYSDYDEDNSSYETSVYNDGNDNDETTAPSPFSHISYGPQPLAASPVFVINTDTYFKAKAVQSTQLAEKKKCFIAAGTTIFAQIQNFTSDSKHVKVVLTQALEGCEWFGRQGQQGFIYAAHLE